MKIIGIYCIVNRTNNKRYVGSSIDIKNRFRQHLHCLKNDKHCNKHLQASWNKYGATSFSFRIHSEIDDIENILVHEEYWINYFDSIQNGYNQRIDCRSNIGIKRTEAFKEACRQRWLGHIQSIEQIEKRKETMRLRKEHGYKRVTGWKLTPEQIEIRSKSQLKQVYQYDLEDNLISVYEGVKIAAEKLGFNRSPISAVCLGYRNTYKGFKWTYTPLEK